MHYPKVLERVDSPEQIIISSKFLVGCPLNNLMFPQQMTRIIVMAKYDKTKLPGSNNMYRTQL